VRKARIKGCWVFGGVELKAGVKRPVGDEEALVMSTSIFSPCRHHRDQSNPETEAL